MTATMDDSTKGAVARKMLKTASLVAAILLGLGELLTRLLHFSVGALSVAGGILMLILAVSMVLGQPKDRSTSMAGKDPMVLATFPLAVPYLLNPVGIVALVTLSAETSSWSKFGVVIGLLVLVIVIDAVVFRWANGVSGHLDEGRMLITEKVFGFLLAAVGIQLVLDGLSDAGVIHLTVH
jgi:small neutral amino acid transporter SnatA (MarC family)